MPQPLPESLTPPDQPSGLSTAPTDDRASSQTTADDTDAATTEGSISPFQTKFEHPHEPVRVLVAWNPNSAGREAITYAAWLARSLPVQVRVISILLRPWPATSLSKLGGKYHKWFKKQAKACKDEVHTALENAGVSPEHWDETVSVFADGSSPAPILTSAARDFNADIVVVGSRAATPQGRFNISSTTDTLLHSSPSPLGLAPRSVKLSKHGITRLNYAFLEPEGDSHTLGLIYAAQLANRLGVPLRILAISPTGLVDIPVNAKKSLVQDLTDQWREHALAMLDRARNHVMEKYPEITVETGIGSGAGWAGAVDALKWKKGDLLCLDSSNASPFSRVFIGSPTSEFLQHIRVPAVVLPASH